MPPLYVDLDGTFIKSDMLYESWVAAVVSRPWVLLQCLLWLLRGRAYLKYRLSLVANITVELLPVNPGFYAFLVEQQCKGRRIILATACAKKYAEAICQQYPLFESFISSDEITNLKGLQKLKIIQSQAAEFAYAGNAVVDFTLFEQAQEAYLVNPTKRAEDLVLGATITDVFDRPCRNLMRWFRELRVHQWLKNTLIFVPLLVSGQFLYADAVLLSLLGFIAFSCVASASYIINDLVDLDADRRHPRKRHRPLAAADIGIAQALVVALGLFILGFVVALFLGELFAGLLATYLLLTSVYTFWLKRYVGVDVITLAGLYCLRIFAGAALLDVSVSFWLFSFSMLVFFSLALVKRCAELKSVAKLGDKRIHGRAYNIQDYPLLISFGVASAMLSVLMFSFYVNSNVLHNQYQQPTLLWAILPVYGYWIMRMWFKTHRGEMHDDPIIFTLRDKGSRAALILIGFTAVVAQLW